MDREVMIKVRRRYWLFGRKYMYVKTAAGWKRDLPYGYAELFYK